MTSTRLLMMSSWEFSSRVSLSTSLAGQRHGPTYSGLTTTSPPSSLRLSRSPTRPACPRWLAWWVHTSRLRHWRHQFWPNFWWTTSGIMRGEYEHSIFIYWDNLSARGEEPVSFCLQTSDLVGLARLASSDTAVALENMPILVELGDIGNIKSNDILVVLNCKNC